ncbi:unnamed protein product [Linum trigynum]
MSVSWRQKCCLIFITLLAVLVAVSEASRLPKPYSWEQMLPKKLPTPSSAPSKGTNSITTASSSSMVKKDRYAVVSSSDGKV